MLLLFDLEVVIAKAMSNRAEVFHRTVIHLCSSRNNFRNHFEVDRGHILFRSAQTGSDIRHALSTNEVVSAVLTHGKLNKQRSHEKTSVEIAVEAKLSEFRWLDFSKAIEITENSVCVRVIVRERKPKHLVVTIYRDDSIDPKSVPEVPHAIW